MPSDLRVLTLPSTHLAAASPDVRPVTPADAIDLAVSYLAAYPPFIGATDLPSAREEIRATFAGEYGDLILDACLGHVHEGVVIGAIFTTTHSIWDDLPGPFVIDLFVRPGHRGRGIGRALIEAAIAACAELGAATVSLRVGEGTDPAAHRLYRRLGFVDPASG